MARATKRLAKAAAALAATGVVRQAVLKAAEDPRVRRKAAEVATAVRKKARAVGKQAGKKASAMARSAGKEVGSRVSTARKTAGRKLKELGKRVAG